MVNKRKLIIAYDLGVPCKECGGTRWVCECLVNDLMRQNDDLRRKNERTYCAYCGFEVPLSDPDAPAKVYAHILNCELHPLGMLLARIRAAAELELVRIEACGGEAGFAERMLALARGRADE